MEQHPVPQNVTTFQFRLIGDMTLKQFGYLAGGAMLGYIFYRLPFPTFIGLPGGVCLFLLGFGFAFVPVEERPMDVWFLSFIKSIYSPTLYVWQREKPIPEPAETNAATKVTSPAPQVLKNAKQPPAPAEQTTSYIQTAKPAATTVPPPKPVSSAVIHEANKRSAGAAPVQTTNIPPAPPPPVLPKPAAGVILPQSETAKKTAGFNIFSWFTSLFAPKKAATPAPIPAPKPAKIPKGPDLYAHVPTPVVTGRKIDISGQTVASAPIGSRAKPPTPERPEPTKPEDEALIAKAETKTRELENKLAGLQHELQTKTESTARILELQKQLSEVLSERQQMQTEIAAMKSRLEKSQAPSAPPPKTATYATPEENKPTVKVITPETAVRAGLPRLTTFANVVTGIIKDNENNLLPGVLVTVRDKEDVPVRALKTNKLGQFAASTPLTNGTYFIEVEDPRSRYIFDRIQVTINGNIVPAIEVVAKSQKELSREKLQKEIFGNREI